MESLPVYPEPLNPVADAFRVLWIMIKTKGRRLQNIYDRSREKLLAVDQIPDSPMLRAKMAPRAHRRQLARLRGEPFRPVYGYKGGK